MPPDLSSLVVGQGSSQRAVRVRDELPAGELAEVQAVLGVSQPDRNRDGLSLGEELGQAYQQRGLARSDSADDHVRTSGSRITQVCDNHVAQLVPAHHLPDDLACRRHDLARMVPGRANIRPADHPEPDQEKHR